MALMLQGFSEEVRHWDVTFWAERLREAKYEISDEQLRPYFSLPNVLQGLFQVRWAVLLLWKLLYHRRVQGQGCAADVLLPDGSPRWAGPAAHATVLGSSLMQAAMQAGHAPLSATL